MSERLCFDQALPAAVGVLTEHFRDQLPEATIVRDPLGTLFVVLPDDALTEGDAWHQLATSLHQQLRCYSPGIRRVLLRVGDLVEPDDVIRSPDRVSYSECKNIWLLDRLQNNQDWLRKPLLQQSPVPTAVAFSIKGGVGRTTAFALWAWHLARLGKRSILVDLDLEAPGVAGILLEHDRLPDYGLIDWLAESLVDSPEPTLLRECLAECLLASDTAATIRVLPACGRKTRDYVNKLGRIYQPVLSSDGSRTIGLAERLQALLEQLASLPEPPDVILLDARSGLHDISSAAVTRLAAQVYLFARDDPAGWQAYALLFEHLCHARSVRWGMPDDDLRWRLKIVGAQVDPSEVARRHFANRSYETWLGLYDAEESGDTAANGPRAQIFGRDDEGPHQPLFISLDPRVRSFNLSDPAEKPDWQVVEQTFDAFFTQASTLLLPAADEGN